MSIEGKFEWQWKEAAGKRYLYTRPTTSINESDWIAFFRSRLEVYAESEVAIIVDVVGVDEDIGKNGFDEIISIFMDRNIQSARIGVIAHDQFKKMLADVLNLTGKSRDFDLDCQVFVQFDSAEDWLCKMR